ncbi:NADP-dependent oxidoreductase [Cocleimonas sp. KMM 6892]|uniref:NADP-dependent oxidoreductase n=1 Tax=unclassified Cocleimonas TaxID=2639732 RepID=UPI002DBC15FB|nr:MULTISPECIES: NADP-dependent oxidoreductase [unclassified Cocleimonas]MEB8433188.1 NADP-dependent oxidoreductase [Cocleimonas sp. KMM 6892]MEC4715831.1 NADP-dependent oxidoreductase [Cocleimonas sp. KMM 6895]MEC4745292.1 NADP-dependent oxidoreductase [Cocleimonas sp. KMM 6896]
MTTYTAIKLANRPSAKDIGPNLFEVERLEKPSPAAGEFLIKQSHMSLDPAMLGWMSADTESYIPRVEIGEVMRSFGYAEVVESQHPDFAVGDKVTGMFGWTEYAISKGQGVNKVDANLPAEMVLSIFALPGLTATQGLYRVGKPKAGETLVVTGAAGSVGSIVGQLAKAEGLRVIGVAGGQEKCDWIVNELGFDGAIDYKADGIKEKLEALTPDGVDVYFENTGGPIQHHVFERMNAHGRIAVCGMIADYLAETPAPGPSWMNLLRKRLTVQGFTMPDHFHETVELLDILTPHVKAGKIKYRAHILEGLESAMTGLNLFFSGENKGKLIVKL